MMTQISEHTSLFRSLWQIVCRWFSDLFDLLIPDYCVVCGERLPAGQRYICLSCLLKMPRVSDFEHNPVVISKDLFMGKQPLQRAAFMFLYEKGQPHTKLIKQFKYRDDENLARFLTKMFTSELQSKHFFDGIDAIVPMPMAAIRRQKKGYNQTEWLAESISELTGIPVWTDVVDRFFYTKPQVRSSRVERQANAKNAYRLLDYDKVHGKHLLVVDDVVTTGFSMASLCGELAKAGGVRISIWALGRTM